MSDAAAMIVAQGLGRRYGRRWALIDVTFQQPQGSVWVVAGPNGSGKSTLLRLLAAAIRIDRGLASIDGIDVSLDPDAVRTRTSLLSHSAYIYEALTPIEHLHYFSQHLKKADRATLEALLDRVGLLERADDLVSEFSAGMRKRLSLARVLIQDKAVILLDEPYAQLDPAGFDLVDALIAELRSAGRTILLASHQIDRVSSFSDHALVLDRGRVVTSGPPRNVLEPSAPKGRKLESGAAWS